mmetsp:Transcript_13388/g.20074  ORF Transcript_13388/g.20074 Transcript_13388/m.20074 type:complete len:80 (-) Transcript_13388:1470-1709(-)
MSNWTLEAIAIEADDDIGSWSGSHIMSLQVSNWAYVSGIGDMLCNRSLMNDTAGERVTPTLKPKPVDLDAAQSDTVFRQ